MGRLAKTEVFDANDLEVDGQTSREPSPASPFKTSLEEDIEIIPMSFEPPTAGDDDEEGKDKGNKGTESDTGGDEDEEDDKGKGGEGSSQEDDDEGDDQNAPKGKTGKDAPPDSSSSSPYLAFAKVLYDGGAITQFDEEEFLEIAEKEGEFAALVELNKRTINDIVQMQFDGLPEDYKRLLDAARKGVPLKEAFNVQTSQTRYSEIKEKELDDNEELAKSLIKDSYKLRGFDDEDIDQEISDAMDINKLGVKARAALKHLNTHYKNREKQLEEKAKEDAKMIEKQRAESLKQIKTTINSIDKLIPGVKLTKPEEEKLYALLTAPAGQDPRTGVMLNEIWAERSRDPEKFDTILAYMFSKGVFKGKMESFVKQAKTDALKDLDAALKNNPNLKGGLPGQTRKNPKKEEIARSLGAFRRPIESY